MVSQLSSSSLSTYHGFHTTSITKITLDDQDMLTACSLRLLYTLPPRSFIDPYELQNYKDAYTFRHWGTSSLELPVTAVDPNDAILLLNISLPISTPFSTLDVTVDVPLHIRFGQSSEQSDIDVKIPAASGFWTCPLGKSCLIRIQTISINITGWQAFTTQLALPAQLSGKLDASELVIIPLRSSISAQIVQAPVGDLADLNRVEVGVAAVVLVVFFYLVHISFRTASRLHNTPLHLKTP